MKPVVYLYKSKTGAFNSEDHHLVQDLWKKVIENVLKQNLNTIVLDGSSFQEKEPFVVHSLAHLIVEDLRQYNLTLHLINIEPGLAEKFKTLLRTRYRDVNFTVNQLEAGDYIVAGTDEPDLHHSSS
ncbi:hypothetical protein [Sneathiella limimaris]|uniref:hypothetical protein n=1 Tax=Sneathiella limimaris TaxID=1964213 RepID=UPI00146EE8DA|nr:hypothetical protein [Sneathiella limimaris]